MRNKIIAEENIFPRWEQNIPTLGTKHSHAGNKTGLRLACDDTTSRASRDFSDLKGTECGVANVSLATRLRLVVTLLLMIVVGVSETWGQTTYTYYAIHNKDKGYLKQLNGGITTDGTFQYADAHGSSGSSIWILSSDGYLQQEMYYLNVANNQTLYLSIERITQWDLIDDGDKKCLQLHGTTKILGLDDSTPVLKEPGDLTGNKKYKYAACEMTITENGTKWAGPTTVSFTVQSPQLVTYLRTYYTRSIIATISKTDAGDKNKKVADKKDSRCYCSLTYSTTSDANKGTKWDINETTGVIYNKQASGDVTVAATYTLAALDPKALSLHPASTATVTLKLQPWPLAPDALKNYLLAYTKDANYRFPYDDGFLNENDAVKTDATRDVLTEPLTGPNDNISWKVVRDAEGFYSFQSVKSGRWLRFDESHFVSGSDYGVVEMGVDGTDAPTGTEYKFRLYKSGTYGSNPSYCILPYSKQYAVYNSAGIASSAVVALKVNTTPTPKVISLGIPDDNAKYGIFAYEAEYRIYSAFTLTGPNSAIAPGNYVFNTSASYSSRNIVGSPSNSRDLEIKDSYSQSDIGFNWYITDPEVTKDPDKTTGSALDAYITKATSLSSAKGTMTVTVNSLPTGPLGGKVWVQAKSGSTNGGINGADNRKWSGWKEIIFNLYGEPSYTEIASLSDITNPNGYYRLTADASDTPDVTAFNGYLDGGMHKITSTLSSPLFTTLTGTVKNLVIENVSISSHEGNTGAIACTANGAARIYNVGILGGSVGGTGYTGGLVGLLDGSARVINCFSYANITGGTDVGGIVGYNNVATTAANLKTMVMNCMFYGDITGGSTVSPVYGGNNINNLNSGGLNTFNYYAYDKLKTKAISSDKYNCALAVEEKYLNRFEFYRLLLNSNKKLAAFYATGSTNNANQMAKWVLETADRSISGRDPYPCPILKAQGYYPSIINPDIDNAPDSASVGRNKGGKLGKTLAVTIATSKSDGGQSWPTGASITTTSLTLQRTDKDFDRYNFNYDKVQLPYYKDVGTGNYTGNRVVTGWKITAITAIDGDPYTSDNYPTTGVKDYPDHNYADRKSSKKDLYTISKRVFSQGAYFDVPYGVTSITIEPYWGQAAYISDTNYDVVYKNDYTSKQNVTQTGTQTTTFNSQSVYNSMTNALNALTLGSTVYDKAVVLVGNLHLDGVPSDGTKAFTMMSVDEDNDHEPDYSLIYHHKNRTAIAPIRFDFLAIPGTAQAQKPNTAELICNFTIFKTKGWFETTNTSLFYSSQLEYENLASITKVDAPLILHGGVIDQFVSTQSSTVSGKTIYIHLGGNVWMHEFSMGTHSDGSQSTPHVPVSVTGGDYDSFYLTGTYNSNAKVEDDNAECYISSGRFGEVAGAGQEQIGNNTTTNGNVHWQIYNADITNFFGGGINDAKPVKGNITTDIYNSYVDVFCGGPKFGNMATGKTVTTNAEGCTFRRYFGGGYGGNSYSRKKYYDNTTPDWETTLQGYYTTDKGKYYNGNSTNSKNGGGTDAQYGKKGPGVAVDFDYEFFVWSSGATGGRFFVKFVSFSLAQCNDVNSTLKNCTITDNFYGGGSLGKVTGTATSVLENCKVTGSVYGGGYSATLPAIPVRTGGFTKVPKYNSASGMFEPGEFSGTTDYSWKKVDSFPSEGGDGFDGTQVKTTQDLNHDNLGSVGETVLTIKGTTSVDGSVFGGGEESNVSGNTKVTMESGYVFNGFFGGGYSGSVGTVTARSLINYDGTAHTSHSGCIGGKPTAFKDGTGKCTVVVTGGQIGPIEVATKGMKRSAAEGGPVPEGWVWGGGCGIVADPADDPDTDFRTYVKETDVTIGGTAFILESIIGGGEFGRVLGNTHVTIQDHCQIGVGDGKAENGKPVRYTDGYDYGNGATPNLFVNPATTTITSSNALAACSHYDYDKNNPLPYDPYYDDYSSAHIGLASTSNPSDGKTWIGCVFGGGSGYMPYKKKDGSGYGWIRSAGLVEGNTLVEIKGGHILTNVYGGNEVTDVKGKCTVKMTGGTIGVPRTLDQIKANPFNGNLYGAGKGDPRTYFNEFTNVGSVEVDVSGGIIYGSVYGGGEDGHVTGNVTTTIRKETGEGKVAPVIGCDGTSGDDGNVFGAGQGSTVSLTSGVVSGNVTLNIQDGNIKGSVYGGGQIGSVGTHVVSVDNENYGKMKEGDDHGCLTVNLTGGTIEQNVYGGCMGTTEDVAFGVSKNVTVELNNGVADDAKGCAVKGSIFGCNNVNSSPEGTVTVHVYGTQHKGKTQIANTAATNETAAVEDAKTKGNYDVAAVYGGGNMAAYVPKDLTTGTTNVIIDGCGRTSIQQVYGGGNAASTPATSVTINGTYEIEEVFGGGNGKDKITVNGVEKDNPGANVGFKDYSAVESTYPTKEDRQDNAFTSKYVYGTGKASVNIFGGTVHRVFGGSNTKGNVRQTAVTLLDEASDCDFCVDEAYGGGKSAPMDAEAKMLMACIPGLEAVYGGAEAADIHDDVTLTITNGTFNRVFGGNNVSGTISGKITVNVEETGCRPVVIGELYGGGNLAAYSIYGYKQVNEGTAQEPVYVWKPRTSSTDEGTGPSVPYTAPQVNVRSFTSIGAVFGGGYGADALMVASPTVNISESVGDPDTYPSTGDDYTTTGFSGKTITVDGHEVVLPAHTRNKIGAIGDVFGGGNAAPVMGDTHVNIGTLVGEDVYLVKAFKVGDTLPADCYTKNGNNYEKATGTAADGITYYRKYAVVGVDIRGNVYGGGNNAEVTGNTDVNIGKKEGN